MLENVWAGLAAFSILEWIGLITGIIYIILSAQNKIACWYFGIVSCACIAYHDFFGGIKLYSDGVLQIFYVLMGVAGILRWKQKGISSDIDLTKGKTFALHLRLIIIGILLSIVYGYMMKQWSDASFPVVDAFTTVFSMIATYLLVNRQISAWVYFVFIDIIMVYLYFSRGWELYSLLFVIYTLVAFYGTWNWMRLNSVKNSTI